MTLDEDYDEQGKYKWKSKLVKLKKDRQASCFVSPTGEWYNVEFGDHWAFTKAVMEDVYHQDYGGPYDGVRMSMDAEQRRKVESELYEKGWVWVHDDIFSGTIVRGRINARQHKVLKESFGNQRLFRGTTIDSLYYEHRG